MDKQQNLKLESKMHYNIELKALYQANKIQQAYIEKLEQQFSLYVVMPMLQDLEFKKLRKNKGLTLKKVEELTGISNAYLSQIERGKVKSPSYVMVKKLLDIYCN